MQLRNVRERLLASTMIGGVALAALAAAPACAQDAGSAVKEVVVTGSRIKQPNLTTTSPVTTVNSQEFKLEGTQRVEDLVNNLPQVFSGQGSSVSNNATGTATVDLRGLGCNRTLVLVDGKRLMAGDPTSICADMNTVPAAMVERVDLVTGGASAVYGSDAVAGVVNIIMKKNFEGVQVDVNHSFYQHENNNSGVEGLIGARALQNPGQFSQAPGSITGGASTDVNITLGTNAPNGKGNITAYLGYRSTEPLTQDKYDYSACALNDAGAYFACGGSSTANPARFIANGGSGPSYTLDAANPGTLRAWTGADQFNFAPYNYFQRNDIRYTAGYFGHYRIDKALDLYSSMMFMDDSTVAQIAPSGIFLQTLNVNCDNPLLSADEVQKLCTAYGKSGSQDTQIAIGKRNQEGGPRQDDLHHTDFRLVLGAKGDLDDNWSYDVYGQYGQVNLGENYQHDISLSRSQRALEVVDVNGVATCKSVLDGTDPNCVPYNIFTPGGVTQAALNYLETPGFQQSVMTEQVVSGSVNGQLGAYGIQSPWAKEGVGVAFGGEYRRESLDWRTDAEFSTGDLAGQGGARNGVAGAYSVKEIFGEARVPLVSDRPLAEDVSLDLGYRRSDYSMSGTTDAYKAEANWTPVRDVRFRASFNRAVRAPNVIELFTPQTVNLDGSTDPCAGPMGPNSPTAAQCARTGVTAAQYGNILANPSEQYNGRIGGNPQLRPEIGDTFAIGTVLQPRFIPGFNLTIDYYDIKVKNAIGPLGADTIINGCIATGSSSLCNLIHRAPVTGSLWLGTGGYIDDTTQNAGQIAERGVDVNANYHLPLSRLGFENLGRVEFNLAGTYLGQYRVDPLPGTNLGEYLCQGGYGPECGASRPAWRHKLRATWTTPWKWQASVQWRYMGGVERFGGDGAADAKLASYNWIDISGSWRIRDNLDLHAGVNNVFDKDPPLVGNGNAPAGVWNGNTLPQRYDALGRYFFMGLTANF